MNAHSLRDDCSYLLPLIPWLSFVMWTCWNTVRHCPILPIHQICMRHSSMHSVMFRLIDTHKKSCLDKILLDYLHYMDRQFVAICLQTLVQYFNCSSVVAFRVLSDAAGKPFSTVKGIRAGGLSLVANLCACVCCRSSWRSAFQLITRCRKSNIDQPLAKILPSWQTPTIRPSL